MVKEGREYSRKSCLKNTKAKLKRREEKIAQLEAKIAQLEEEAKKKAMAQTTDCVLRSIAKQSPDTSSRNSLSGTPLHSDAKQIAALEILSQLLKD